MIRVTNKIVSELIKKSRKSERKRFAICFHKKKSDKLQRILNVIQPESKVEPHLHKNKTEVFIALKGRIRMSQYDDKGNVIDSCVIKPGGKNYGVEIPPKTWHSMRALEKDSAVYIVIYGPYNKKNHKIFAKWKKE